MRSPLAASLALVAACSAPPPTPPRPPAAPVPRVAPVDTAVSPEREAARKKALAAVEALAVVEAYCRQLQAQRLGCLVYFGEEPTEEGCGEEPALESSCWLTVEVAEAHETHSSRFGTFLVDPRTFRVVGATGYCSPVPIARFTGSSAGCDDP